MKLLLRIAFVGTRYHGFQKQKNGLSVQETLTTGFSDTFGFPVSVTGSSRTDAGVHARSFCITVEPAEAARRGAAWCSIPPERLHLAARLHLPPDIAITGCCMVPDSFHPRYSAIEKTYTYEIWDAVTADPFRLDRAWQTFAPMDDACLARMRCLGQVLVGKHDFSAFMAAGSRITDAVRTITELRVARRPDGCVAITVSADGFLYHMVRILAGTLVDGARGGMDVPALTAIVSAGNRSAAGKTAPACGLYLERVRYPAEYAIPWQNEITGAGR